MFFAVLSNLQLMPKLRCIDSEDDISVLCGSFALATKKSEKTDHRSLWASINVAANNVGCIDNPASVLPSLIIFNAKLSSSLYTFIAFIAFIHKEGCRVSTGLLMGRIAAGFDWVEDKHYFLK